MNSIDGNLLYLYDDGCGLLFENQTIYKLDTRGEHKERIVSLHSSKTKSLLCHFRLAVRLLRLEPRCAERLDKNKFVVCYAHKIWILDIKNKLFDVLQESREGFSNPLNLCSDGKSVYWGDYGDNVQRKEVNIYRLTSDLKVETIYTFPKRAIRHIHNVIWDEIHMRFFILTGDLEESSGIYVADEKWKTVNPVFTGSQQYRAVVAFPCGEGLIYATDSIKDENNIYLLQEGNVKLLAPFPGSCIYGAETKDYYAFSSTVEPSEGRGLFNLFSYKLGSGIKDRYAHMVIVRKSDLQVQELLKVKKDLWPMKLFQYGALTFPKGQTQSEELYYNIVACKGDGKISSLVPKQ